MTARLPRQLAMVAIVVSAVLTVTILAAAIFAVAVLAAAIFAITAFAVFGVTIAGVIARPPRQLAMIAVVGVREISSFLNQDTLGVALPRRLVRGQISRGGGVVGEVILNTVIWTC